MSNLKLAGLQPHILTQRTVIERGKKKASHCYIRLQPFTNFFHSGFQLLKKTFEIMTLTIVPNEYYDQVKETMNNKISREYLDID